MQPITSISDRLIYLLKNKEFVKALTELFSEDVVSIDPLNPAPGGIKGLGVLIERERDFLTKVSILNLDISEAIHAGNYFSISLFMNFIMNGRKMILDELCIYKVCEGKIISQQFFIADAPLE